MPTETRDFGISPFRVYFCLRSATLWTGVNMGCHVIGMSHMDLLTKRLQGITFVAHSECSFHVLLLDKPDIYRSPRCCFSLRFCLNKLPSWEWVYESKLKALGLPARVWQLLEVCPFNSASVSDCHRLLSPHQSPSQLKRNHICTLPVYYQPTLPSLTLTGVCVMCQK